MKTSVVLFSFSLIVLTTLSGTTAKTWVPRSDDEYSMEEASGNSESEEYSEEEDCSRIGYLPFSLKQRVCGSDGNTYLSPQHVRYENCVNKNHVTIVKDGWCEEEHEVGEQIKSLILGFIVDLIKEFRGEESGEFSVEEDELPGLLMMLLSQLPDSSSEEEDASVSLETNETEESEEKSETNETEESKEADKSNESEVSEEKKESEENESDEKKESKEDNSIGSNPEIEVYPTKNDEDNEIPKIVSKESIPLSKAEIEGEEKIIDKAARKRRAHHARVHRSKNSV